MCERLKQTVLKIVIPERVSGVRIPLPPPSSLQLRECFSDSTRIGPPTAPFLAFLRSKCIPGAAEKRIRGPQCRQRREAERLANSLSRKQANDEPLTPHVGLT